MVTKENALFLLPGFGYLLHRGIVDRANRRFSVGYWWFAAAAPVALYLLFAQLKNEVMPAGLDFNLALPPPNPVSPPKPLCWQRPSPPGPNHAGPRPGLRRG